LFGFPNEKEGRVDYGVAVPGLLSWLVHGNGRDPVNGLDKIPRQDWPPVAMTFHSFHMMVGLGTLFIVMTLLACVLRVRKTLFQKRWLLWLFVLAIPLPYVANQVGWVTAEVGRQPWIVYGLLRTKDAFSKAVSSEQTLGSIFMFVFLYGLLFAVWLYVLNDKIRHGPDPVSPAQATTPGALADLAALRAGTGGSALTRPDATETPRRGEEDQG
jgi:cytochrome d ubiquinol oxidase subunit I